ncbi:MAG: hypothetical protein V3T77_04035 [Planctomycetota bacterium]
MTSASPSDSQEQTRWRKKLTRGGFLHVERSLYNLQAILQALTGVDGDSIIELSLATPDPDLALNGLERILSHMDEPEQRQRLAEPQLFSRLALLVGTSDQLAESVAELFSELTLPELTPQDNLPSSPFDGADEDALRRWHRLEILRICLAELEGKIDVEETALALSRLADFAVQAALKLAGGEPAPFAVIALGKWGGMELNYSSDIDFYLLRDNQQDVNRCEQVARHFLKILDGNGSGHLYRTDLRLRPGGPQGALVPSVQQVRQEFRDAAGTWERLVHIRARLAAGDSQDAHHLLQEIEEFVYERPFHLDEIREVKGYKQLLERSALQHVDSDRELKIGWGGIRDVEYVVQFLQLLHGDVYDSIRGGNVFRALRVLGRIGALTGAEAAFLRDGYDFLRRVEHRLMLRHRLQTFLLPEAKDARRALARGVGLDSWEDFQREFDGRRDGIREILDRLFHRLFTFEGEAALSEVNLILAFRPKEAEIERVFAPLSFRDPHKAYTLLQRLAYPRRKALQAPRARQFFAHLFPELLRCIRATPDPDQAVLLFSQCVETLGAPATFYQLLAERPENCTLFVDLFGRSRFISDLLLDQPGILDEVIDRLRTGTKIEEESLVRDLREMLTRRRRRARVLHEFRAVHMLEIAVLDLGNKIPLLGVIKRLSAVARATLRIIDELILAETVERLGKLQPRKPEAPPRHAIIALGRLGGEEMGYASDLDMILIYDGEGETASGVSEREFYTQLLQNIISTIGNPETGGVLYPVDLRLRPRGKGGALLHSFREFRSYFQSDESQVWEHQALVRSAPVTGDLGLGEEVMTFIRTHIGRGLAPEAILQEMGEMHARRKAAHGKEGFYLKTGPGGLLDIEFLVQSAILLSHLPDQELWQPNTYAAIRLLEKRGLIPSQDAAALSTAYLFFRLVENRLSMLHRASVRVVPTDDASLRDLALRIGYQTPPDGAPEKFLMEEIQYHTRTVQEIFRRRCE